MKNKRIGDDIFNTLPQRLIDKTIRSFIFALRSFIKTKTWFEIDRKMWVPNEK